MKPRYERFVELANEGAKELGFKDLGALWRSGYDMPPDEFAAEVERLWTQVKPLYDALHCYARRSLRKKYGQAVVPADGPIPAHLLGNMWAQQWGNVYDLMGVPSRGAGYDLTKLLAAKKTDAKGMVKLGDRLLHLARLRAAAADLLGALALHQAGATATWSATPAPGTSTRTRTCASRCASSRPARTSSPSTTSSGTTSTSAPIDAADPLPQQRQRRLPRGHRRRHRAVGHARLPGQGRPPRPGARPPRATSSS